MRYKIERVCWNEKTYNGYEDNPYWLIKLVAYPFPFGLGDDGKIWSIYPSDQKPTLITEHIKSEINTIIKECKLN